MQSWREPRREQNSEEIGGLKETGKGGGVEPERAELAWFLTSRSMEAVATFGR